MKTASSSFVASPVRSSAAAELSVNEREIARLVRIVVAEEDPTRPHPDSAIGDRLFDRYRLGVSVHTLARCREYAGIPSARDRRPASSPDAIALSPLAHAVAANDNHDAAESAA